MTKLQIRMRQVDQVKDFVDLLSKYPYEMDLVSGRYTIDAKCAEAGGTGGGLPACH